MSLAECNSTADIISKFGENENDSGRTEVQIAILTARIKELTKHFEHHRDDKHSKRGMMKLISQRKKHLAYLKKEDIERYRNILAQLGLRK